MSVNEIWTLAIAGLSAAGAIASALYARNANSTARNAHLTSEEANKTAQGSLELSLREAITTSKSGVHAAAISLDDAVKSNPTGDHTLRKKVWTSALEDNLNIYEKACGLYLDKKLDDARFKKDYFNEIRELVKDSNLNPIYFNPTTSNYQAILKVNTMWNNLET